MTPHVDKVVVVERNTMNRSSITAFAAAALLGAAVVCPGPASARPAEPVPAADQQMDGMDAVMMIDRSMWECMYGANPGIPRAVSNDRGVMFYCMHQH